MPSTGAAYYAEQKRIRIANLMLRYDKNGNPKPKADSRSLWERAKDKLEDGLRVVIDVKNEVKKAATEVGKWWQKTDAAKWISEAKTTAISKWNNSALGKTVAKATNSINKAVTNAKTAWDNSSVGKWCNKAANSVKTFYEEHKTAINMIAGTVIIAGCLAATLLTGGLGAPALLSVSCSVASGLQGAAIGAMVGGALGFAGGAAKGTMEYMEEHDTLDGAGSHILETASTGYVGGAASGAVSGFVAGYNNPTVCFVAGTMVLTAAGLVAIEEIEEGDKVYSTDPETGESDYKTVVQTFVNETYELTHVTLAGSEEAPSETITTTPEHPFYVEGRGWVGAAALHEGMEVWLADGTKTTVEDVEAEESDEPTTVYNFEIEDYNGVD